MATLRTSRLQQATSDQAAGQKLPEPATVPPEVSPVRPKRTLAEIVAAREKYEAQAECHKARARQLACETAELERAIAAKQLHMADIRLEEARGQLEAANEGRTCEDGYDEHFPPLGGAAS